jgi:putative flippase GtrA
VSAAASLARRLPHPTGIGREVVTFAAIGIASTAAYAVLYLLLRRATGPVAANAIALVVTAVANTTANRRLTFGVRERDTIVRDQLGGLAALVVALAITTVAANLLPRIVPHPSHALELAVLIGANVLATVARFALLRAWIAGGTRTPEPT